MLQDTKEFISSLSKEETKFYDIESDKVLDSLIYIDRARVKGEIIGIGGIAKWYIFPHTFYMIKKEYQGRGIGTTFAERNVEYAKDNLSMLLTVVDKENGKAVALAENCGFIKVSEHKGKLYCYLPLGFWDWLAKLAIKIKCGVLNVRENLKISRKTENKVRCRYS